MIMKQPENFQSGVQDPGDNAFPGAEGAKSMDFHMALISSKGYSTVFFLFVHELIVSGYVQITFCDEQISSKNTTFRRLIFSTIIL